VRLAFLPLVLALLGLAPAFAPVRAYSSPHEDVQGLRDRFKLNLGGFFPSFDTQVLYEGTDLIGTIVRLEQNLDLDSSTSNYRLEGHWRFSPRSRVEFSVFDIQRGSLSTLDKEIVVPDDTTFLAGARLETKFDTTFVMASYKWSFYNDGKVDTGFSAGLSVLDADLGLDASGSLTDGMGNPLVMGDGSVDDGFTFPVPVVGQYLDLTLHRRLFYRAGFQLFYINVGEWRGNLLDVRMSLDYYFNRRFGLGLGFNLVDIRYTEEAGTPRLDVDYRFSGATGYLSFVF